MHTLPGVPFSFFTTAHEPRRPIGGLVPGNSRDVPATFRFIPPCAPGNAGFPSGKRAQASAYRRLCYYTPSPSRTQAYFRLICCFCVKSIGEGEMCCCYARWVNGATGTCPFLPGPPSPLWRGRGRYRDGASPHALPGPHGPRPRGLRQTHFAETKPGAGAERGARLWRDQRRARPMSKGACPPSGRQATIAN